MGVLMKNKINYSGGNMDSYESPNLDYDSAVTLTLPDYTGYSYTMPADGVIMTRSYGSVGSTVIITNSVEYGLSYRNDTWSVVFIPFEKGTVMTIRRGSSNSDYSSGSWIKFIPYKVKFGGCTPLHEYSSNEHIVGTWIDGSPIYEKTFKIDNPTITINPSTLVNLTNNEVVIDIQGYLEASDGTRLYNNFGDSTDYQLKLWFELGTIKYRAKYGSSSLTEITFSIRYVKTSS